MSQHKAIQNIKAWYKKQTPPMRRVIIFAAAICLWMLTGIFSFSGTPEPKTPAPFDVVIQPSIAQDIERILQLRGEVEPDREANIRAETAGRVAELRTPKGTEVKRGDILFTLATDSRLKRIEEAKANLDFMEKEFKAAESLEQRGFQAKNTLSQARSSLERARANLADMELDYSNSQIKAPFDGIYEDRYVDVGDSVALGTDLATVIDIDPLVLKGFAPQDKVNLIRPDRAVQAHTLGGIPLEGHVRYLASQADPATRTYAIEVAVPNPENLRLAGSSVTMEVSMGVVPAHFVSSAFLSLNAEGTLGVKALTGENKVAFYPAQIAKTEENGVWLAGLPDVLNIITVGHGFISPGQEVTPHFPEGHNDVAHKAPSQASTQVAE